MHSFALIVFLSFFLFCTGGMAININATIDDAEIGPFALGEVRLADISFYPPNNGMWGMQVGNPQTSVTNLSHPDNAKSFRGTGTAASNFAGSSARSIVIDFFGSSITAFFTLFNDFPTECDVTIDETQEFRLRHAAGSRTDGFSYQVPAITYTGLQNRLHRLEIKVTPFNRDRLNYVNFDYAEYTYDGDAANKFREGPGLNTITPGNAVPNSGSNVEIDNRLSNAQLAGIASGTIGGSIIIAAIVLVIYFRSRAHRNSTSHAASSVHSKIDVSYTGPTQAGTPLPSMFKRLAGPFGVLKARSSQDNDKSLPVSESQYSQRYSTASSMISSNASSKGQPMYEEYNGVSKWERLTPMASNSPPQQHRISSFRGATMVSSPNAVGGRRDYGDNRLDSLGLHLTNIQSGGTSLGSNSESLMTQQGNARDITAPYQYSIRRP